MDPNPSKRARIRMNRNQNQFHPNTSAQSLEVSQPTATTAQPDSNTEGSQQMQPRPSGSGGVVQSPSKPITGVNTGMQKMCSDAVPIPIGRGSRAVVDYQSPRPQSSLESTGKQGTSGQPIKLLANYFPITSYTNWCLYQYRVDFNPEEDRIIVKKALLSQHRERLGGYLFDGTVLYSSTRFDTERFELTSQRRSDNQTVIITVKFTNVIETGDYANIQVFNLLLRNCLRHLDLKLIGRNFFDANAKINIPQHKLQLWPGYETSIGKYEKDILLCAEITTKVMRQETVLDFLHQCTADRNSDWMINFKSAIVGTTVMTVYNNETYRIDDIDENSDPTNTFQKKDGTMVSYIQYYKEKWNVTIRKNRQPMLISKSKKSPRRFDDNTLIYLVPELCIMTGITNTMRNNFTLMRDLAVHTRVNPGERMKRLTNFAKRLHTKPESVAEFKKWNLTLNTNLVEIPGRVLPFEPIRSNIKSYDGGYEADWTKHLRSLPMFTCASVAKWIILGPREYYNEIRTFSTNLQLTARGMSFILPQPFLISMNDTRSNTYLSQLEHEINDKNPALILCIIPSPRVDVYNLIKRKLCVDRAVPSQVVLLKNVRNRNLSVCTKIAIQLNCKLGGAPWHVTIPQKGMMIIGFDVCHDRQRENKSYGALVATMNDTHTSYFSCVEPHDSGEELSKNFGTLISKALMKYKLKNKTLPTSIIVYRDGVGEGQLSYVHNIEIKLFKATCIQFYGPSSVSMAFIIVKKRINTRFFSNSKPNGQNPPPGTIVDSVVTDPTKYDFFLISQHVRQGTVTPTHYQVIEDTLRFPPDIMQKLTYKLTHMYYNWSGTIRVPAQCQLAHKLAFLAGQTLRTSPNTSLDELLYFL